jgi:hypothetical protein
MPVNPFDEDAPLPPPQVPISGNPFEDRAPVNYPPPATALGNAADFAKAASNTFSMGMRDRLEGGYRALTGEAPSYSAGVDQAVADSAMRRERSPYLSVAGDVAGGTAQAYVPGAGAIGRTVSRTLGGALPGAYGTGARAVGYGIEGGVLGAAQAAGNTYSGNASDYGRNALIGGALGGALGAPFGPSANVADRSLATAPSSADLKAETTRNYTATHAVPIAYDANHFWGGLDALEQQLYGTTNQVKSPSVWETLRLGRENRQQANQPGVVGATVSPKNIDELRQQLTGVNEPGASQARQWLDNYMQDPSGVVRGGPREQAQIGQLLNQARGNYRAAKRTQTVEETNQYASDRAASAYSGQNVENTYRQKLVALLNPKSREGRWYSPEEKADIRSVVRRDTGANVVRGLGNLMGGGLGAYGGTLGAGGAATAFMTGDVKPLIAGIGIPAAGYAVKSAGNRAMVNAASELADRMAMRSPLYRERAANAPTVAGPGLGNFGESTRNAITIQMLNQLKNRGFMGDPTTEE